MSKLIKVLVTVMMVFALSACSTQDVKDDSSATVDDQTGGDTSTSGVTTSGIDRLGEINGIAIGECFFFEDGCTGCDIAPFHSSISGKDTN